MPELETDQVSSSESVQGTAILDADFPRNGDRYYKLPRNYHETNCNFEKTPAETLDFRYDFDERLEETEVLTEVIGYTASEFATITRVEFASRAVLVFVSGGTKDIDIDVTVFAKTSLGVTHETELTVKVLSGPTTFQPSMMPPILGSKHDYVSQQVFTDAFGVVVSPPLADVFGLYLLVVPLRIDTQNLIYAIAGAPTDIDAILVPTPAATPLSYTNGDGDFEFTPGTTVRLLEAIETEIYDPEVATMLIEAKTAAVGILDVITLQDAAKDNYLSIYSSGTDLHYKAVSEGVTLFDAVLGTIAADTFFKVGFSSYKYIHAAVLNGGTVFENFTDIIPDGLTEFHIGADAVYRGLVKQNVVLPSNIMQSRTV